MYEIWLVLNIVWEIALGVWPLLALAAVVWLALMALAWRRPRGSWRAGLRPALVVAALATAVGLIGLPAATRSSLQALSYWVDWANLLAIALGLGAAVLALAWPAAVLMRGGRAAA